MEIETYSREAGEQKMMHSVMYVQVWGKMIYIDKNRDQPYTAKKRIHMIFDKYKKKFRITSRHIRAFSLVTALFLYLFRFNIKKIKF